MAPKAKTDKKPTKTDRKATKETNADAKASAAIAGTGHNVTAVAAHLKDFFKEMDDLKDDQEKVNGEFAVDIGNVKEKFANQTGHTRAHLTEIYGDHRRALKREKKRKDMEEKDRDALDLLELAALKNESGPLFRRAQEIMEAKL